jgi:hypothetical protein
MFKRILLVSLISGLITSNILTLLDNEFHQIAFDLLTKSLGYVVTQENLVRISSNSPTQTYATLKEKYDKLLALTDDKDYVKLKSEYDELQKNHRELTASNEKLSTDYATLIGKHDELLKNNIALEANKLSQLNTLSRVSDSIYQRLMYRIIRVSGSLTKFIPILGDIFDIGAITMEVKEDCQTFDELNELRWHSHLGIQDKPEVCFILN